MKKTLQLFLLIVSVVLLAFTVMFSSQDVSAAVLCPPGSIEAFPGSTDCVIDPSLITKFQQDLVIPPAMPTHRINARTVRRWIRNFNVPQNWWRVNEAKIRQFFGTVDYYEIAVRPLDQQILDPNQGFPATPVWSYGAVQAPGTVGQGGSFNYPAFTIEASANRGVLVKWINDLVDDTGKALPHILAGTVDQTVHWANPVGDCAMAGKSKDCTGTSQVAYDGPVPMVTHVHGAHVGPESDGYPEAWWLPAATDVTCKEDVGAGGTHWCYGTLYDQYLRKNREVGTAYFLYPNTQRATTLWYHDHTLGMTRLNVYAGPAGFYLIRGGADDVVVDRRTGQPAVLPGPAPRRGDAPGTDYYEIPIVIQGRSFKPDGTLFYPADRPFFEGLTPADFPGGTFYAPNTDILPIWNPEAFFNVMVVNGVSWPKLAVEPRRYRIRFLNGCNSRFLILRSNNPAVRFWQIGASGGFLKAPVRQTELLLAPAERADVIMDFSRVDMNTNITITNVGPDEPFGGGEPGTDFVEADDNSTKPVMQFQVTKPLKGQDMSTDPRALGLPAIADINPMAPVRKVSLNEGESHTTCVLFDETTEEYITPITTIDCAATPPPGTISGPFGPTEALLGTVSPFGVGNGLKWNAPITENPALGATETWEIHNFTADAHPIHLHLVMFRVVERVIANDDSPHYDGAAFDEGTVLPPEASETGWKDTVIAYPGEITKIQTTFDREGLYVWHCHIVEHEDNEMMRPYYVGDAANSPVPVTAQ